MSWALEFVAHSKTDAVQHVRNERDRNAYFPVAIAAALEATVQAMPEPSGAQVLYVKSIGHIDAPGSSYPSGYAQADVKLLPMAT